MTTENAQHVSIDGTSLTIAELKAITNQEAELHLEDASLDVIELAHSRLVAARDSGAVYGANTGVGANRAVNVDGAAADASDGHARRLLRSHCAAVGEQESAALARATMVVRLNQIAAGHSGVSRQLAAALSTTITT